jgi:hypothetical protein
MLVDDVTHMACPFKVFSQVVGNGRPLKCTFFEIRTTVQFSDFPL